MWQRGELASKTLLYQSARHPGRTHVSAPQPLAAPLAPHAPTSAMLLPPGDDGRPTGAEPAAASRDRPLRGTPGCTDLTSRDPFSCL